MTDKYILRWKEPVPVDDLIEWAKWYETADRIVAVDGVSVARVSTVFLGLDHSFGTSRVPILFETMVFGGPFDGFQARWSTWGEAEMGHLETVKMLRHPRTWHLWIWWFIRRLWRQS